MYYFHLFINQFNLKYIIEEIYSIRFIKDTSNLRNQLVKQRKSENNEEVDNKDPFPIFCVEFLINKYVKMTEDFEYVDRF